MAHLGQHPQSAPRQPFPLNSWRAHMSFEAPLGPARGTGVSSSPKLFTPPLSRKKDIEFSLLHPKAPSPTRKAALDSLRVCSGTSANLTFQHERQPCSKEFSSLLAGQKTTFMSRKPEQGCNFTRYELDATVQPRQRENEESGGLHLVGDSLSLILSCSQAPDSRDNNAGFSWNEETSPTKGRLLARDSKLSARLVSDRSPIPKSDDCRTIQDDTEEVTKQHGGQKRVGPMNNHHPGIHVQGESLVPVPGAKTCGHPLFFPEAAAMSNAASSNGHARVRSSHLHCKSTRYSSGDHHHSDIEYQFSLPRPLVASCGLHCETMLLNSRHLQHGCKEADENCRSARSPASLGVLPVSCRLPVQEDMLVKGCTIRNFLSKMEPYRLAIPHMDATKPVFSSMPTERRNLDIYPDGGDDDHHGNANSSEEKEQEDKCNDDEYDDDDEDDDDSNEDCDDFDEMFNTQTHLAELTLRHQRLSLSVVGLPCLNYAGKLGDSQEPQPVKKKVNLSRRTLTKNQSERGILISNPGTNTDECEQSDLTDTAAPARHEGKPLSEQMMKEYFRQLKVTICSNEAEEKFIDELVMRNAKACSLYDQFSNVKLSTNGQGSDGPSAVMSPRCHDCSVPDGEAENLKTLCLLDTGCSCGSFQVAEEPIATKSDTT